MRLLAMETSGRTGLVALEAPDGTERFRTTPADSRHGRHLVPTIQDLLAESDLRVSALEALAVGVGPGSFTGLRIGVTAAKLLAHLAGCPLVAMDSLEVLAGSAPATARTVAVVVDAQRGELFVAGFHRGATGAELVSAAPTARVESAPWLAALEQGTWVIVAEPLRSRLAWPTGVELAPASAAEPAPGPLLRTARAALDRGDPVDLARLEPHYLRRSAAEEQRDSS